VKQKPENKPEEKSLPVDRHGIPVLDEAFPDTFFASLFEQQQQHGEMVRYDGLAEHLENLRKVVDGLDAEFQVLRDRLAHQSYCAKHHYDVTREELSQRAAKYVAETREMKNKDRSYGCPIPDGKFFLEVLLPVVRSLASTLPQLVEIAHTAFDALERLLCCELTSNQLRAKTHVVEGFFDIRDVEHPKYSYRIGHCSGQFQYFYKKYGADYALAVAQLQGWLSDEHCEGASYCWGSSKIEDHFRDFLQSCPETYRGRLMQIYTRYCRMNHYWGAAFVHGFEAVVRAFVKNGKQHLIPLLLDVADLGFHIHVGDHYSPSRVNGFPLFSPESMMREVEALSDHPFRSEMLAWARRRVQSDRSFASHISFVKTPQEEKEKLFDLSFADQIENFRASGLDDSQIRTILALPETHPWLADSAESVVSNFLDLEKKFPGGAQGMIEYLQKLLPSKSCISACITAFRARSGQIPPDIDAPAYQTGIELVQRLGDAAAPFFQDKIFRGDEWRYGRQKQIDFSDPKVQRREEIRMKRIRAASKIVEAFPLDPSGGNVARAKIFQWLISFKKNDPKGRLFGGGDPKDLEAAIAVFKEAYSTYPSLQRPEEGRRELWRINSDLQYLLEHFERVCQTVSAIRRKGDTRAFPSFENLARYVRFLSLDLGDVLGTLSGQYCTILTQNSDIDPTVAMVIPVAEHAVDMLDVVDLEKLPVSSELLGDLREGQKIAAFVRQTRKMAQDIYRSGGLHMSDEFLGVHARRDRTALVQKFVTEFDFAGRLAEIRRLRGQKKFAKLFQLDKIERDLTLALNTVHIREMAASRSSPAVQGKLTSIVPAVHTSDLSSKLEGSEFFRGTNPGTKLAILGTSMRLAMEGPAGKYARGLGLEVLPFLLADANRNEGVSPRIREMRCKRAFDILARNIAKMMPVVEREVLEARRNAAGFMPQGLKVHTPDKVNRDVFAMLSEMFNVDVGGFAMERHEGICLPPLPTALELRMLTTLLEFFVGVRAETRQLQTTMAGRLSEQGAAIQASTILLTTPLGGRYRDDAFATSHGHKTGGRLVIFDAGVRTEGLPFDVPAASGRTDILGRRALEDVDVQKVVGTLVTHGQFGGHFEELFDEFRLRHLDILRRYGLESALHFSAWIADHAERGDSLAFHGAMVDRFATERLRSLDRVDLGIVRDMGHLVADMAERMRRKQPRLIAQVPDEFTHLMRY